MGNNLRRVFHSTLPMSINDGKDKLSRPTLLSLVNCFHKPVTSLCGHCSEGSL